MSYTVLAHYNIGNVDIPIKDSRLEYIPSEGDQFKMPSGKYNQNGGVIVISYDTNDKDMLISVFKKKFKRV